MTVICVTFAVRQGKTRRAKERRAFLRNVHQTTLHQISMTRARTVALRTQLQRLQNVRHGACTVRAALGAAVWHSWCGHGCVRPPVLPASLRGCCW